MSWLLDTCALSEYIKKNPAVEVIQWLDEQDESQLFISIISLGEIEKGIIKLRQSDFPRSQKLTAWLGKLEQRFSERTLMLDSTTLHIWANLSANAELQGRKLPVMDALLMATVQCHGLAVVTRNEQDFNQFPHVFNPWGLTPSP